MTSRSPERLDLQAAVIGSFPEDLTRTETLFATSWPTEWFAYGPCLIPGVRMGPRTRYWDGHRWRPVGRIRPETVRERWIRTPAWDGGDQAEGWLRAQHLRAGPGLDLLLERGLAKAVHRITALVAAEGVLLALNAHVEAPVQRAVRLEEAMELIHSMDGMVRVHSS